MWLNFQATTFFGLVIHPSSANFDVQKYRRSCSKRRKCENYWNFSNSVFIFERFPVLLSKFGEYFASGFLNFNSHSIFWSVLRGIILILWSIFDKYQVQNKYQFMLVAQNKFSKDKDIYEGCFWTVSKTFQIEFQASFQI